MRPQTGEFAMNLFASKPAGNVRRIEQIRLWVRERLTLTEEAFVLVTELRCSEPGCPPLETVIAILDGPGQQRQFKLHRAIAEIEAADIRLAIPGADHGVST
jgi:hypothetical protein